MLCLFLRTAPYTLPVSESGTNTNFLTTIQFANPPAPVVAGKHHQLTGTQESAETT